MDPAYLVKLFGGKLPASRELGVSRQTIYNWLAQRKIPARALKRVLARLDRKP
jgi:hypothetical protein